MSIFREDRLRNAGPLSPDEYQVLKGNWAFEWVGAARIDPQPAVVEGHTEITTVAKLTPHLAEVLSLPLNNGVVISRRMRKAELGGQTSVIGSRIRVNGADIRVDGIAPDQLEGLYSDRSVDVWVSARKEDIERESRERRDLWVVARRKESVSLSQAREAVRGDEFNVVPFTGLAPNIARGLLRLGMFLSLSAAAVFVVASINVASFPLGRALRRSHETSLRIALGATRGDLLRDLLADSVVIAVAGGLAGLLLGVLTARALPALLFEGDAERLTFAPRLLSICATSLSCVALTVICGMAPVLGTVTDRPWMVLQREASSPSRAILRLRSALVIWQISLCCTLVVCAAAMRAGLHSALETSAGHQLGDPVLLTVQAFPMQGPEIDTKYFSDIEREVSSTAGLRPLPWMERLPGNEPTWKNFRIQQPSTQFREVTMDVSWLTAESLQKLDGQPVAGRMFGISDERHRVAVVNEEGAAELLGKQTVGMVIRDSADLPLEIIGVVKESGKEVVSERGNARGAGEKRRPTIYYGYLNQAEAPGTVRNARFRLSAAEPGPTVELNVNVISQGYFSALGMPLVTGQKFEADGMFSGGRVAVINQEAADLFFAGKALGSGVIDDSGVRTEVVGVARSQAFSTFEQHAEPTIYFPMWQDCPARMTLMLKAAKWNGAIAADLLKKVERMPGSSPLPSKVTTLDSQLEHSGLAGLRIATLIGGVSAAMALLLGLAGVLNAQREAERQRQRDRALRIALGAQRWRIVMLVMQTAGRLALLGTAIGILFSLAVVRFIMADAALVTLPSLQVWLIAPLIPVAAVMMVSIVPAGRASVVAPAAIMRDL